MHGQKERSAHVATTRKSKTRAKKVEMETMEDKSYFSRQYSICIVSHTVRSWCVGRHPAFVRHGKHPGEYATAWKRLLRHGNRNASRRASFAYALRHQPQPLRQQRPGAELV